MSVTKKAQSVAEKVKQFVVEARKAVVTAVGAASAVSVSVGVDSTLGHYLATGLGIATVVLTYWTPNGIFIPTTPAPVVPETPASN